MAGQIIRGSTIALFDWLRSLLRPVAQRRDPDPSDADMKAARERLESLVRPAILGRIGGAEPPGVGRAGSWWGGNFLGVEGEAVPRCQASGRTMEPLLQIRTDTLPRSLPALDGVALLCLWADPVSEHLWDARDGTGFAVRTYSALDKLVELGPGKRKGAAWPTFPVFWAEPVHDQPAWEDMAGKVPRSVAGSAEDDWFFESRYARQIDALRGDCAIKLGGWPAWLQGSAWPEQATFVLQVDSNNKGGFNLGDAGSIYLFRTTESWEIRGDCC